MYAELKAEFDKLNSDKGGQIGVIGSAISAVAGIIGILVYVSVYAAMNKDNIDSGTQSMLLIVPLVLGAVIILGSLATVIQLR